MRSRSQTWRGEAEPHNWTVSRRRPVRLRPRERAKRSSSSRPPRWQRRRHAFFTFLATATLLHTERTRSLQCYVLDLRGPAAYAIQYLWRRRRATDPRISLSPSLRQSDSFSCLVFSGSSASKTRARLLRRTQSRGPRPKQNKPKPERPNVSCPCCR